MLLRDQPGQDLLMGQAVSGIRGSAILFQALTLNCGNLRRRCQAKGPSLKSEADSSKAPPRDGAVRSSVETAAMAGERRGGVIWQAWEINRATGRNPA